ncbi:putative NRPS-like protein biosynthetic cluster [Elasticomyces elasticus]|nr:putative NRPS-like protein biosynthetic cluster [Elasticomyces elasticus]
MSAQMANNHVEASPASIRSNGPFSPIAERTMPQVVDQVARVQPEAIWASYALSDNTAHFRDVTFRELAHCVNHVAWWVESLIGRSDKFETLAYMGVSDIRYGFMLLASIKCGYKLMLNSVRNSDSGNLSLLEETVCDKFFCSTEFAGGIRNLQKKKPDLQVFVIPTFEEMLGGVDKTFPYNKPWLESHEDPILICHTSGSTGIDISSLLRL